MSGSEPSTVHLTMTRCAVDDSEPQNEPVRLHGENVI